MPDDLSGWGYCSTCHRIHDRDEDGYVCSDTRPLPVARVRRPTLLDRVRSLLRLRQRS